MPAATEVKLLFGGDLYAGQDRISVGEDIRALAQEAGLVSVNLECPLTNRGEARPGKVLNLRSRPDCVALLESLCVDVVSLANNHVCDWEDEGLFQTLEILASHDIRSVGAGRNRQEADSVVRLENNGLTIAFAAYGDESIGTPPAQENRPGCAIIDPDRMCRRVSELSQETNIVVVHAHWGGTHYHYPMPRHVQLGHELIDAGATLVVGHHPHVIQGYEQRGRGAIFYSLGNFLFAPFSRFGRPAYLSRHNLAGLLAEVRVGPEGVRELRFHPTRQDLASSTVSLGDEAFAVRQRRRLVKLSKPLKREGYNRFFRRYARRRLLWRALCALNPLRWRNLSLANLVGLRAALGRVVRRDGYGRIDSKG